MTKLVPFANDATSLVSMVQRKTVTPTAITEFYLDRLTFYQEKLNATLNFERPKALEQAGEVESRLAKGEDLPLAGVPVLIKDNICTTDFPTTCGSKFLANYTSPYDATVVSKLREAGAIIIGKANLDEFAMGSSNENSAYGSVANPWDMTRVPGGSSGGSAAAVAADLVPVALGSDTGGSIRQPAAFCGIAGLKPTYGMVSRYGLVAFGSSLDQIGPLCRSVRDLGLVTSIIGGYDGADSTSLETPTPLVELTSLKPRLPAKIGIVRELMTEGTDPTVRNLVKAAAEKLQNLGADVVELSLPDLAYSIAAYYVIATAEASANLARFDGVRYGKRQLAKGDASLVDMYRQSRSSGFGREVKQRIMLGTYGLSAGYYDAFYEKAEAVRERIREGFREAFSQVDLLISPTAPSVAFRLGEKVDDPLAMYMSDVCTIGANLAGIPAMSIPCGLGDDGLPVGLQFMASWFDEKRMLEAAYGFENASEFRHPSL